MKFVFVNTLYVPAIGRTFPVKEIVIKKKKDLSDQPVEASTKTRDNDEMNMCNHSKSCRYCPLAN